MKLFSSSTSLLIGAAALMGLFAAAGAQAEPHHGGPGNGPAPAHGAPVIANSPHNYNSNYNHTNHGPRPGYSYNNRHSNSNFYFSYGTGSSYYRPGWGPRYAYRPYPYYYPAYPLVDETVVYQTVPASPLPQSSLPVYADEDASDEEDGRYCREFQRPITVGGIPQAGYGRACMQPDGSWEIIS